MKNKKKRKWPGILLILIVACILSVSVFKLARLRRETKHCESYGICLINNENMRFSDCSDMREKFPWLLGGYAVEEKYIEQTDLKRMIKADVVYVNFPVSEQTNSTAHLLPEDNFGCLMSDSLMYALFGTAICSGQNVDVDGATYLLRGVIPADEQFMIIQYRPGITADAVRGVWFDCSEELYNGQYLQLFASTYGLGANTDMYYVKDYTRLLGTGNLPAKWSEPAYYRDLFKEKQVLAKRRFFSKKDVFETYYYHFTVRKTWYTACMVFGLLMFGICMSSWIARRK